jgi:hypothetical protein
MPVLPQLGTVIFSLHSLSSPELRLFLLHNYSEK